MLCSKCEGREATVFLSAEGAEGESAFCGSCAEALGIRTKRSSLDIDISLLFARDPRGSETGSGPCPACGALQSEVVRYGRIGCSRCLDVFKAELDARYRHAFARAPVKRPASTKRPADTNESTYNNGREAGDVILSSSLYVRRNIEGIPFPPMLVGDRTLEIEERIEAALVGLGFSRAEPDSALVRATCSNGQGGEGCPAFEREGKIVARINQGDHLILEAPLEGLPGTGLLEEMTEIAASLDERLGFAFSTDTGFLSPRIADWGTGLAFDARLHLPALEAAGKTEAFLKALLRSGFSAGGVLDAQSHPIASIRRIGYTAPCGLPESESLERYRASLLELARRERALREELLDDQASPLLESIASSFGHARYTRSVSADKAFRIFLSLRLGTASGLVRGPGPSDLAILDKALRDLAGLSTTTAAAARSRAIRAFAEGAGFFPGER